MTPSEKRYVKAVGNLYNYNTYVYIEGQVKILVMVLGLAKQFGRWYYTCQPLDDKEKVPEWMYPSFKSTCVGFDEIVEQVG